MGVSIRYDHGVVIRPGRPTERPTPADVRNDKAYDRMGCTYCYTDDVQPLSLYENISGRPTSMAICPNCGAGLTPAVDISPVLKGLIESIEAFEITHIED